MHSPALTVLIVHWNHADGLRRALAQLRRQGVEVAPVVIDNGSRPDQLEAARAAVGAAGELVELGENRGFGPAANVGFEHWLSSRPGEWVALMPHDALPDDGALRGLLDIALERPRLGLLSADVGDGATPVVDPYFGGITRPASATGGFEAADHPHGTLMLARRGLLESVGLFDERYFAYCEEADLGLRATAAGWEVGIGRGVMVRNPHMGPGSAGVAYLQLRNTLLLVRERSGRYHVTIRLLMAIGQIARSLAQPSSRDPLHHPRARLLAIWHFLRGRYGAPPSSLDPAGGPRPEGRRYAAGP